MCVVSDIVFAIFMFSFYFTILAIAVTLFDVSFFAIQNIWRWALIDFSVTFFLQHSVIHIMISVHDKLRL